MATSVSYTYRYPFESVVEARTAAPEVRLATSLSESSDDLFFDGKLREPTIVSKKLSVLCDVVRSRFYQPLDPLVLDPVVTSGGGVLRFEGFSSCCGVYVRVDLPPPAFDVDLRGKGTTNVDFNDTMRTALRRMNADEDASLQVGGQGVTLKTDEQEIFERKVKLPFRWIKGFCEVQAYQPRLVPVFELSPIEARDLFRSLPKSRTRQGQFIHKMGRVYRLSPRKKPSSVFVEGFDRLRALESLIPISSTVQVWYDEDSKTSGWQFDTSVGRLFALISPELSRGFSGEGQMLEKLAVGQWQSGLVSVADSLNWQSQIDPATIGSTAEISQRDVEASLAVLGARGLAGFDVTTGKYFHRVLPFDLEKVEQLQPRLKNARALVDDVEVLTQNGVEADVRVPGSHYSHYVRLRMAGNRCTCHWYMRHQGQRGPCKHILAARMAIEGAENVRIGDSSSSEAEPDHVDENP